MKRKKIVRIVYFLFLSLFFLLTFRDVSFADESGKSPAKVVRVAFFESGSGFFYKDAQSDRKSGYAYDYLQAIAEHTGWKYEYVYGGWSNLFEMLQRGEIDVMADISYTKERSEKIVFSQSPMGVESYYVYGFDDMSENFSNNAAVLSGKRISVGRDTVQSALLKKYLLENKIICKIIYFDSESERIALEKNGKIDAFVCPDGGFIQAGYSPIVFIGETNYYFAINKARPDLAAELDDAMQQIHAENPYYSMKLQQKYLYANVIQKTFSKKEKNWMKKSPELIIGYCDNYLPYCAQDVDKQSVKGILKSLIDSVAEFTGLTVKSIAFSSSSDMLSALLQGKIDAAFPVYGDLWTSENKGYFQSRAVYANRVGAAYHGSYKDPQQSKIAVSMADPIQEQYVRCFYPKANICKFQTMEDCLKAIQAASCDVMFTDFNVIHRFIGSNKLYSDFQVSQLENPVEYCFGILRKNKELCSILNKVIGAQDPVKISSLVTLNTHVEQKYTFFDFVRDDAPEIIFVVMLISSVIIFIFITDNRKKRKNQKLLRTAMEEAARANKAKSEFLAKMSHDMRTPMNAILCLSILMKDKTDITEIKQDISQLALSGQYLLNLINDTLDMSRIESGKMKLNLKPVDIKKTLNNILSIAQLMADDKEVTLEPHMDNAESCSYSIVVADAARLEQIFLNLLSNAIKFTPSGKRVAMDAHIISESSTSVVVRYTIRDEGIGMQEDFLPHLFEPFAQENRIDNGKQEGAGLGMAIVKQIIDLMNGSIEIKSKVDEGTDIAITLEYPVYHGSLTEENNTDKNLLIGKRILLAEDSTINRMITVKLLEKRQVSCDCAINGQQCVEYFTNAPENKYDAILMDIRMPVMDGLEATRSIRKLARQDAKKIPIIALTANAFDEDIQHCIQAGMNAHLAKPIEPEKLYQILQQYVR